MTQLAEVWATTHAPLEKYLRRRLKLSRNDAEEVVADAATTIQRKGLDPTRELLARIAIDIGVNRIRTRARREEIEDEIAPLLDGRAIPTIEGAMFRADFDRAFRGLTRPQAEAFALTELRGLTVRETAEVLGTSRMTVQRRCEAARTHLQKELS